MNKLSLSDGLHSSTISTGARGPKHSYRLLILLSVVGLLAHNSYAIPMGGEVIMFGEEFFNTGNSYEPKHMFAWVQYQVLGYDDNDDDNYDEYLYAYRVFNVSPPLLAGDVSHVGLELFSVGVFEGADAHSPGFEYGLGGGEVAPTMQYVVGEPAQSVTYLFILKPIEVGEYSTLLTFWSDDAPKMGYGTLFGGGISQVGNLPAPVPEPGSILLLGAGAVSAIVGRAASLKRHK